MQPGVEVDAAPERAEAMVRDDHQQVAIADLLHDPPQHAVVVDIELLDGVLVLGIGGVARSRVVVLEVAPEHVLDAIGRVEDTNQRALAQLVEGGEEHLLALAVDVVGELEKGAVVDDALVERPGVLGQPQRRELADLLGQVGGVVGRV